MLMNVFLRVVTVAFAGSLASAALAVPITFFHKGFSAGTLGGVPFPERAFTITALGDTSQRVNRGSLFFIDHLSAKVDIAGLGTQEIATPTRTFVNGVTAGFSRAGYEGLDLFNGPSNFELSSWQMTTSIGPTSGEGYLLQWETSPVITSGGILVFPS
jgi:hypothetical protein